MSGESDRHVVTNAAGGLNQTYHVGDIVLLNDVGFRFRQLMASC